ncbi:MAG TPA: SDR family oxidoreductase [Alphaproteobacteria bacterium]|nr:SDR family oxidoreductase [Alphaproteobacteria bacterium]
MRKPIAGQRVIVTAGAAGIGLAIAAAFLSQGAKVFICDVDHAALDEFRKTHPGAGATMADVAEADQVDRLFQEAGTFLGGLDVLVNNAGIAGPTGPVEEISQEDWRRTLAVNLEGQFLCTRRAVPLLRQAGGGAIINLSSAAGRFGFPRRTPYSASKWGVIGFTKSLAVELGPDNIRVNAILPGAVDGPRIRRVISAKADSLGVPYEEMEKRYVSQASLRRMVTADDIAGMAVFLASPAGYNVSGQALPVDADTQYLV